MADLERFNLKGKLVIYTRAFVKLYNLRNCGQVDEIYGMMKLENMRVLTLKYLSNLGVYLIIQISLILHSVYVIFRYPDKFVFYINNYIDWEQFNQFYDPD